MKLPMLLILAPVPGVLVLGVLVLGAVGPPVLAQDTRPAQPPVPQRQAAEASPPPLLREGSFVMGATGTLRRDGDRWVFQVAPAEPTDVSRELTMLPCTLLANLEKLVESMPGDDFAFDLTGQVFVYNGRNYLLPTHAPRLVAYVAPTHPPPDDGADGLDDSATAILRDLDRAVGPVVRSPRTDQAAADRPKFVPPGSVILWRRGWLVRGSGGAWSFIFSADAAGSADPPMILLPCLLLEDMERHAARSGPDAPLLVSGRVYRYHDRTYLLPTMFLVPREHTVLRP